ncbi:MAG TPA: 2-oxoacid:acceptor oxidoreductase family protein [Planctomycetota bacterium]|nr:2-oxoacid:acceptor oxidoreductase family protein [Planctomycetota bacterium]
MLEKVIMAGFGGQGLLFMGKLVAQAMMNQGKHVTYFPSYGAEVRGGTANCHVIISDDDIHSPVADQASTLVIMNTLSYERFAASLQPDGLMFLNTSIVDKYEQTTGTIVPIAATDEANDLGNARVGNMIMMGAYVEARNLMSFDTLIEYLSKTLTTKKPEMLKVNIAAVTLGRRIVQQRVQTGELKLP